MGVLNAFVSVATSAWAAVGVFSGAPHGTSTGVSPFPMTAPGAQVSQAHLKVHRYGAGERQVERAIGELFLKNFRTVTHDEKLSKAARLLAEAVLALPAAESLKSLSGEVVQEAIFQAGGTDSMPSAIYLRGSPPHALASALANHPSLDDPNANAFGVAMLSRSDGKNAGVVILSHRQVQFHDIPKVAKVRHPVTLSGYLTPPLLKPELAVTGPDGTVSRIPILDNGTGHFSQRFSLMKPGRSVVEVLAEGPHGLEVVAMFPVFVSENGQDVALKDVSLAQVMKKRGENGPSLPSGCAGMTPVKGTGKKAAAQVLTAINALRVAQGLSPVVRWSKLDELALSHAQDMVDGGFFGHKSPTHGDLGARLLAAEVDYQKGAENIGEADSALAAHGTIETSPGHRSNVLLPDVTHVGIGVVSSKLHPQNVYVVEIFIRGR